MTRPLLMAATFATLLLVVGATVRAENPNGKVRMFALIAGHSQDGPPPPDLTSPDSHVILANDIDPHPLLTFAPDAPSEFLAGKTLTDAGLSKHITKGGVETVRLLWLDGDVPPAKAVARTGPDGNAEFFAAFYIRPAQGSEAGGSSALFWVAEEPCASCLIMYLGVGVFSR